MFLDDKPKPISIEEVEGGINMIYADGSIDTVSINISDEGDIDGFSFSFTPAKEEDDDYHSPSS
jgi:phage head maturation protease